MNIKKIFIIVFIIIICLFFIIIAIGLDDPYNFNEHRKTEVMIDSARYTYQDKVRIEIDRIMDEKNSKLIVRTKQDWDSSYTVLSGEFEKVGWHDDVLYIMSDYKYYSFDINSYVYPQNINNNPPVYEMLEYSYSEFITLFPNYQEYHWFIP